MGDRNKGIGLGGGEKMVLMEGIWEEIARIEGHLGVVWKPSAVEVS